MVGHLGRLKADIIDILYCCNVRIETVVANGVASRGIICSMFSSVSGIDEPKYCIGW
jgi:hypothetical protein